MSLPPSASPAVRTPPVTARSLAFACFIGAALGVAWTILAGGASLLVPGLLLLAAGLSEAVQAVVGRRWRRILGDAGPAALLLVAGLVVLSDPTSGSKMISAVVMEVVALAVAYRLAGIGRDEPSLSAVAVAALAATAVVWIGFALGGPTASGWIIGLLAPAALAWTGWDWLRRSRVHPAAPDTAKPT